MTNQDNATQSAGWRGLQWPALVAVLLAGHVFIVTGALLLSSTWIPGASQNPKVESDSLTWDQLQALREASRRLGWTLEVTPTEETQLNGDRLVRFVLRDADGLPVEGAELAVTLYHLSRPNQPLRVSFEPDDAEAGRFETALRLRREGLWRVNASATRGDDRFLVEADVWISQPQGASS